MSIVFYSHSPEGVTSLAQPYWLEIANFPYPRVIQCSCLKWPLSNLWKSFTDHETSVLQAANSENLAIPACTVIDWSTHVVDKRMDRQTELQWLRRTIRVPAVARKNLQLRNRMTVMTPIPGFWGYKLLNHGRINPGIAITLLTSWRCSAGCLVIFSASSASKWVKSSSSTSSQ